MNKQMYRVLVALIALQSLSVQAMKRNPSGDQSGKLEISEPTNVRKATQEEMYAQLGVPQQPSAPSIEAHAARLVHLAKTGESLLSYPAFEHAVPPDLGIVLPQDSEGHFVMAAAQEDVSLLNSRVQELQDSLVVVRTIVGIQGLAMFVYTCISFNEISYRCQRLWGYLTGVQAAKKEQEKSRSGQ